MMYRASPENLQDVRNLVEEIDRLWRSLEDVRSGANLLATSAGNLAIRNGDPLMIRHLNHASVLLRQITFVVDAVTGHSTQYFRLLRQTFADSLQEEFSLP